MKASESATEVISSAFKSRDPSAIQPGSACKRETASSEHDRHKEVTLRVFVCYHKRNRRNLSASGRAAHYFPEVAPRVISEVWTPLIGSGALVMQKPRGTLSLRTRVHGGAWSPRSARRTIPSGTRRRNKSHTRAPLARSVSATHKGVACTYPGRGARSAAPRTHEPPGAPKARGKKGSKSLSPRAYSPAPGALRGSRRAQKASWAPPRHALAPSRHAPHHTSAPVRGNRQAGATARRALCPLSRALRAHPPPHTHDTRSGTP